MKTLQDLLAVFKASNFPSLEKFSMLIQSGKASDSRP